MASISVLHVDDFLLVLDKPAGLLSVPGRGVEKADCLSARVQAEYPDALVVHRLDLATSGIVVMARGRDMQRRLGAAFAGREVSKRYVAIVAGRVSQPGICGEWAEIDLPIAADWPNRPLRIIDREHGQASLTRWRVLGPGTCDGSTRLELEPVTGRTHQLRVHLKAVGHPILGDALYAAGPIAGAASRLLLHACDLRLVHPHSGEPLAFSSPPPF